LKSRRISQRERAQVSLEDNGDAFEALACRAHPRAEDTRMGRSLVVRMVRGMFHRLDIDQPAEQQEATGEPDRDRLLDGSVH
jgi:hypothetical protein